MSHEPKGFYQLGGAAFGIDPTFGPLRDNPRFRKLVQGTA
jgi:hypothetical protein